MDEYQDRAKSDATHFQSSCSFFDGRAKLLRAHDYIDDRGTLMPFDFLKFPFTPRRLFVVHNVPVGTTRGGHAHQRGEQLLIRLSGELHVDLKYELKEEHISLTESTQALLIGPRVWSQQTYVTTDTILLVIASHSYHENSYILASEGS